MTPIQLIKDYLTRVSELYARAGGDGRSPDGFYLAHGMECGDRVPWTDEQMEAKQCYYNCWTAVANDLVDPDEWFYCEGYAVRHSLGIPINHAWLVNRAGDVMDPTWDEGDASYYGVPFQRDYLLKSSMKTGYPSPCWSNEMFNADLLTMDPSVYREDL